MKYFKDEKKIVYAYESDGSQDEFIKPGLVPITEKEAMEIVNPPPTHDELVAQSDNKKAELLSSAQQTINLWQTELQLGVISDIDRANLLTWIQYIKKLQAVDTAKYPNIIWPLEPAV